MNGRHAKPSREGGRAAERCSPVGHRLKTDHVARRENMPGAAPPPRARAHVQSPRVGAGALPVMVSAAPWSAARLHLCEAASLKEVVRAAC